MTEFFADDRAFAVRRVFRGMKVFLVWMTVLALRQFFLE